MGNKKNQHYVPKSYLRNFSNNGKNVGLFMPEKNIYRNNTSIKSVAYSPFLYGEDGIVEDLLSKIESRWASVIRKIINNKFDSFNQEEYILLYSFIVISKSRTKKEADIGKYFFEYFKDIFESKKIDNIIYDSINMEQMIKTPNLLQMIISLESMNLLFDLEIVILENKTRYGFITSDNPIIYYNQLYTFRKYKRNYGIIASGLQIFIPLNNQYMICLFDKDIYDLGENKGKKCIPINSKSETDKLNKLSVINAYNQIFFHPDSKEKYIKGFKKLKKPYNIEDVIKTFPVQDMPGEIIKISNESIDLYISLKLFKIRQKYLDIDLPTHQGGLQRNIAILKSNII